MTTLGFSKDAHRASVLFMWHKEKHSKCENYKRILDMCFKNNLVSVDQVDSTNIVELLKQEESLGKYKYNLSVDGCRVYKSLMSICHAENVFPNEHMDSSNLWISIHKSEVNGSDSSNSSLAWETRNFIENAWNHLNETNNQTRSVIESAWHMWNETDSQIPSFGIPIREKRSIVSPQHHIQTTPIIYAKPKEKRQIGAIASSLLGIAK